MKICSLCKQEKNEMEFHKHSNSPDGLKSRCKACRSKKAREYRKKDLERERERYKKNREWACRNREKVREYQRQYRERNREKLLDKARQFNRDNPEIVRMRDRKSYYKNVEKRRLRARIDRERNPDRYAIWRNKNRERIREVGRQYYRINKKWLLEKSKSWYRNNKEKRYRKSREWNAEHPYKAGEYQHRRRAKIYKNGGDHTAEEWSYLLELCHNKCVSCHKKRKITKDHIVPVSLGGKNSIDNIQPLCKSCNCKKALSSTDYRPKRVTQRIVEVIRD